MNKYRRGLVMERVVCVSKEEIGNALKKRFTMTEQSVLKNVCFFFSMKLASVCKLNLLRSIVWLWKERVVEVT